jgi:signal transduction histidine kinase
MRRVAPAPVTLRLLAIQLGIGIVCDLAAVAFAPRLLLLDARVLVTTLPTALWVFAASAVFGAILTVILARPAADTMRGIADADTDSIEAGDLAGIYALPSRIVLGHLVVSAVAAASTILPVYRPETNDLYTAVALVLLYMTMVSAGALPLYVRLRAAVSRVLEHAPPEIGRAALIALEDDPRTVPAIRTRFLAAVALPVAFVALGASLLVYAHARAFDAQARERTASELARGVFDLVKGTPSGRNEAIAEAETQGFRAEVSPTPLAHEEVRADDQEALLSVPLEDGHAVVRFDRTRLSPITGVYFLLAVIGTAIAGILGARIATLFTNDLALATMVVRATGVADVIRGTKLLRQPRFRSVRALLDSIDRLGDVFREFAAAQQRAIEARAATERMRGLFLASMSHDLKAPLNAILGFGALVGRSPLTDGQRESLSIIEQRGRELLALIQTILDSARVEAGALEISPEPTVMGDVVMSAVLDARDLVGTPDVHVVGEVQPGMPPAHVDSLRMVQALTAVITTAVRFTDKGAVNVRATYAGERLRIDVETAGRGLPADEREKIFEAFKYADKARRHGGLGLGLALARSIIEIHGGSIDVDNLQGGGVVFHVWLPVPASGRPPYSGIR